MTTQLYVAAFLILSSFGGGYQVATWKHESELFIQQQAADVAILEMAQDASDTIDEYLNQDIKIQTKWRIKYEKVYIREPSDCLDADGVWDWNDANEAASKATITLDSLSEVGTNPNR